MSRSTVPPGAMTLGEFLVFSPGDEPKVLRVGATLGGGAILAGFLLPVAEVFGWLGRPRRRGPEA